jgi:carboxymethylenebutenolidase
VAAKPDEAGHLMKGLDWNKAMEDVRTGVAYLHSRGVKKVGVVGFCMGGALVSFVFFT